MTRTLATRSVQASALAAGFLLLAGGAAQADGPDAVSAGNNGIANGNQAIVPVQAPISVCGNSVAVAGISGAGCKGGSTATLEVGSGDMGSAGNNGIGNGNQLRVPIQAPIDVCGNSVGALLGVAGAGCKGGADASQGTEGAAAAPETTTAQSPDMVSAGNRGIANGTQVYAPIQVPINVCGNSVAVLGVSGAGCKGGADASNGASGPQSTIPYAAGPQENVSDVTGKVLPGGSMLPPAAAGDSVTGSLPAGDVLGDVTGQAAGKRSTGSVMTQPEDGPLGLPTDKLGGATQQLPIGDSSALNNGQVPAEAGPGQLGLPTDGVLSGLPTDQLLGGLTGGQGQNGPQPSTGGLTGGQDASQPSTGADMQTEDGPLGLPTDKLGGATQQLPTDDAAALNNGQTPAEADPAGKVGGAVSGVSQQLPTHKLLHVQPSSGNQVAGATPAS